MLQDPAFFRRDYDEMTDTSVCASGCDFTSIVTAAQNANPGDTILVYELSGAEQTSILLNGIVMPDGQPLHIYFLTPGTEMGPVQHGGDWTFKIWHSENIVIDGFNNFTIKATTIGDSNTNWGLIGVGPETFNGGSNAYSASRNIVFKNLELDGGYYDGTQQDGVGPNTGAKWGYRGGSTYNLAFCNLNVHNIAQEHGFYQGRSSGNFEVVHSTINVAGRTCIQHRHSGLGDLDAVYIYADNTCLNSCDGSSLTAHDASGKWFIHGNVVSQSVGGFASLDSSSPEGSEPVRTDHSDGRIYMYDNIFMLTEDPEQLHWTNPSPVCSSFRPPFRLDYPGSSKGPTAHVIDNVFFYLAGNGGSIYSNACGTNPGILAETDQNVIGFKFNSAPQFVTMANGPFAGQACTTVNVPSWQSDPYNYDLNSTVLYQDEAEACAQDWSCFD